MGRARNRKWASRSRRYADAKKNNDHQEVSRLLALFAWCRRFLR